MKLGRWAGPDHIRNLYTQRIKLDLDAHFFLCECAMDLFGSLMKSTDTFTEKIFLYLYNAIHKITKEPSCITVQLYPGQQPRLRTPEDDEAPESRKLT